MKTSNKPSIEGYKGFGLDMRCCSKQYKKGQTYRMRRDPILCNVGMHFCTIPIDVLSFYPPATSRYCTVIAGGVIKTADEELNEQKKRDPNRLRQKRRCETKAAAQILTVNAEIGITGLAKEHLRISRMDEQFPAIITPAEIRSDAPMYYKLGPEFSCSPWDCILVDSKSYSFLTQHYVDDPTMLISLGWGSLCYNSQYHGVAITAGGGAIAMADGDHGMSVSTGNSASIVNGCDSIAVVRGSKARAVCNNIRSIAVALYGDSSIELNDKCCIGVTACGGGAFVTKPGCVVVMYGTSDIIPSQLVDGTLLVIYDPPVADTLPVALVAGVDVKPDKDGFYTSKVLKEALKNIKGEKEHG
jgi:hypothetical protein